MLIAVAAQGADNDRTARRLCDRDHRSIQRIGRATGEAFARRGVRLVLAARKKDALEQVSCKCKELGATDAIAVPTDVTDASAIRALAARAREFEASDRVCGKRLVSMIPVRLPALERHGRLKTTSAERALLTTPSAATIDRMLIDIRVAAAGERLRRVGYYSAIRREVPIRTFNDWANRGQVRATTGGSNPFKRSPVSGSSADTGGAPGEPRRLHGGRQAAQFARRQATSQCLASSLVASLSQSLSARKHRRRYCGNANNRDEVSTLDIHGNEGSPRVELPPV